jgi:hypothetical protein
MNARYSIGTPIPLARDESFVQRHEHYCHLAGEGVNGKKIECASCKLLETGDHLVSAEAATEIGADATPARELSPRHQWPGRRAADTYPWIALVIVALVACVVLAVPDESRLDPPIHRWSPPSAR